MQICVRSLDVLLPLNFFSFSVGKLFNFSLKLKFKILFKNAYNYLQHKKVTSANSCSHKQSAPGKLSPGRPLLTFSQMYWINTAVFLQNMNPCYQKLIDIHSQLMPAVFQACCRHSSWGSLATPIQQAQLVAGGTSGKWKGQGIRWGRNA